MNIKQLLLTSALCTFSAQAMQEVKRGQEVKEKEERKEAVELRELQARFPHSVKFLIKVLGAQKDKQKTLLDKINPFSTRESLVIKKGLPDVLILKIINNYLWIEQVKYMTLPYPMDSNDMFACTIFQNYVDSGIRNEGDIDRMWLMPEDQDSKYYRLTLTKNGGRGERGIAVGLFKFMDHSVLDFGLSQEFFSSQKILNKLNKSIDLFNKAKENKYKIVAGLVSLAGITYYIAKKLRK